jgi:hypothetical protein
MVHDTPFLYPATCSMALPVFLSEDHSDRYLIETEGFPDTIGQKTSI